jgi:urea carboxylase
VCPFTVLAGERWKLGQLRAGDAVRFEVVAPGARRPRRRRHRRAVPDPVLAAAPGQGDRPQLVVRRAGDRSVLVEFGPHELDLGLRLRVGVLMDHLTAHPVRVAERALVDALVEAEAALPADDDLEAASRVVHLPLSWDDPTAREAAERYARVVRPDAPWCPWNLEFIRRINGLPSVDDVHRIVFDASYLVLALGDVYLGAPVATPVDPRHRLVTTKYNPARTWTAENAVGIGGAYLCVYGMEGPGGYQLIGRTVQMWNRWRRTADFAEPWLLRPFDQLRFHPVSVAELLEIRADLPAGRAQVAVEPATFRLADHRAMLRSEERSIAGFRARRRAAFLAERARWAEAGLDVATSAAPTDVGDDADRAVDDGHVAVPAPMAGMVSRVVTEGTRVRVGDPVVWLEAMKSETALTAAAEGVVTEVRTRPGAVVRPGAVLAVIGP